ncbi:ubiquitin-associated (UBA)/TS-N domain-containing protein [Striga hermonthica]|uniref:Ubiquitin-associated (UBA)/TS-N domain-containing protein n=1 Tax=Striga hermonthica TaxID=68872 RepID=A0A9N7RAZ2_STRHE|nr:ubiquitin-associated (UBA)/TS-N domain-containing protein [Striga hermonthica]
MVVPEVSQQLLAELEEMGFPKERAVRALHFSGNSSLEDAANWIVEHENDPDIDKMLLVPVSSKQPQAPKPSLTPEEIKLKQQELRERARKKKEEEEKRMEREKEKERIRVGRELLEAKRIEEENERKRILALRKAEKEEERRAREKIRQKLEEDKAERRRKLGLPVEESSAAKSSAPVVEEKKSFLPVRPATKAEQMRECLRTLKQNYKDDDAKVKTAFNTLLTFAKNVATNPNEEKFHKIRITNANFQERVGKLKGGIEFLELCGFEKMEGGEFLYLPREKVDIAVLHSAGRIILEWTHSAAPAAAPNQTTSATFGETLDGDRPPSAAPDEKPSSAVAASFSATPSVVEKEQRSVRKEQPFVAVRGEQRHPFDPCCSSRGCYPSSSSPVSRFRREAATTPGEIVNCCSRDQVLSRALAVRAAAALPFRRDARIHRAPSFRQPSFVLFFERFPRTVPTT